MYKIKIEVRGQSAADAIDLTLREQLPTAADAAAKAIDLGFAVAELLGGDPSPTIDEAERPTRPAPKAPPKRKPKGQRSKPSSGRRCSLCREPGHRRDLCPQNPDRHENRRRLIENAAKARARK